ncbi:MAG: MauE/DoxX family redox-associated membrane protein [Bacteroidota bacterium]
MASIFGNKYLTIGSRLILGLVFVAASIEKIALPEGFAVSVEGYQIIPFGLVNIFAIILPWLELICGIFIMAGICIRSSAVILSSLLLIFIVGIFLALARNLNIDCGCFGSTHASPIGLAKLLEDAGLLILSIQLTVFPSSAFALSNIRKS